MAGGLVYTMYQNGKKYEQKVTQEAKNAEIENLK